MKILTIPHKTLYLKAKPVEVFGSKLQAIIDRMFIAMYQHEGIGLAANQVGILKQIIVLNMRYSPMVLINPVIRNIDNKITLFNESCLSIPDYSVPVERSGEIHVISHNRYGKEQNFEASGLLARCIQHEYDHLRGKLINDV